jgi:hypothetical protein
MHVPSWVTPVAANDAGPRAEDCSEAVPLLAWAPRPASPKRAKSLKPFKSVDTIRGHYTGSDHVCPDPLLVGSFRHETPHLIGFGFQPSKHHVRGTRWNPDMEVIRAGSKAFHHKVQQPRETDAHGAADFAERDALTQQVFHEGAPLVRNATVFGRRDNLTFARLTLMILLTMAGMAMFLIPVDPHVGHASLMSMAAGGLPAVGTIFDQPSHGTKSRASPVSHDRHQKVRERGALAA